MPTFIAGPPGQTTPLQVALTPLGSSTPQGQVYVDPQNVSGIANDLSPPSATPAGQSVAGPVFRSWRGLVAAWGTLNPIFNNVTMAITFLSGHTDGSDPIVFLPVLIGQSLITITLALPAPTATVTLSSVTGKNRAGNQLLQGNLGALAAAQMYAVNASRVIQHSSAFVFRNVAGNVWTLSQPLWSWQPAIVQNGQEDDGWLNGQTVNLYTLGSLNIVAIDPIMETNGSAAIPSSSGFGVIVNTARIFNSLAATPSPSVRIGEGVQLWNCICDKEIVHRANTRTSAAVFMVGVWATQGMTSAAISNEFRTTNMYGCIIDGSNREPLLGGCGIGGDTYIIGSEVVVNNGYFGTVYIDGPAQIDMFGGNTLGPWDGTAESMIYGTGVLLLRSGRLAYTSAFTAVHQFVAPIFFGQSGPNNKGVAYNSATGALTTPITLSAANLDATVAGGGFGGVAYAQADLTKCYLQGIGN